MTLPLPSLPPSRRAFVATLLYVVPLLLTAAFLAHVGLALLGVALLAVEGAMVATILLLRRRPVRAQRTTTDGSTFLLLLGGGIVVVGLALTAVVLLGG